MNTVANKSDLIRVIKNKSVCTCVCVCVCVCVRSHVVCIEF